MASTLAMDFKAARRHPCEQILIEHCYGYPLGGEFVRIDYCYDIPRILHCHVNPANQRFIKGGYSRSVIDAVVQKKTFSFAIDHTDNAVLLDLFTFGVYGGAYLGPASYGQLTSFNLDCVTVGIHKLGDGAFNRNWQIAQGSIIANTGARARRRSPDHHRRPGAHRPLQCGGVLRRQPGSHQLPAKARTSCSSAETRS